MNEEIQCITNEGETPKNLCSAYRKKIIFAYLLDNLLKERYIIFVKSYTAGSCYIERSISRTLLGLKQFIQFSYYSNYPFFNTH